MKIIILTLSFLVVVLLEEPAKPDLIGCWTDSREEYDNQAKTVIFRPCSYKKFPASRYRFKMEIQDNSKCSWLYLAPNDGHYMKEGTWSYNENSKTLRIYDMTGDVVRSFEVEYVDKNVLRLNSGVR